MQVLLLAFSGVRIVDPALAALGLTLPGFAERARAIARLPSLGLLTLAARVPPGTDVAYRERGDYAAQDEEAAEAIAGAGFALVAISALSAAVDDAYALAEELRKRGIRVVIGGLHASAVPEEAARHADAVVIGEAEARFERTISDAVNGALAPTYRATPEEARRAFGSGPMPRWDLIAGRDLDRVTVQTERGCALDCSFCGASRTISPPRRKSLARIEAELDAALAPRRRLELADDNTFSHRRDALELVRLLASRHARWFTETDLGLADQPELLEALAESGCVGVLVGLEAPRSEHLRGIDSRGLKARWADEHAQRVERIQAHGIPVTGCFVLGLDTQRPEVFEETFAAVQHLGLAEVQVTLATPFPGTRWRRELEREGRLVRNDRWSKLTLFDVAFEPRHFSREELASGFRELVRALYGEEATAARRRRASSIRRKVRRGVLDEKAP